MSQDEGNREVSPKVSLKSTEEEKPPQSREDSDTEETPGKEKPAEEKPSKEKPDKETPDKEKPANEQPAKEKPDKVTPPKEPPTKPSQKPNKDFESCIPESTSGEYLPKEELNEIISKTIEILEMCQKKVDEQKIDSHSLAFMLLRIKESLDAYRKDCISNLNAYLFHADRITADYYGHMYCELRNYGDCIKAIASSSEPLDNGSGNQINKTQFINLTKSVIDNYYAAATSVKSCRLVYKDINNSMPERLDIVNKVIAPMDPWMELQDSVNSQLEGIRQQTFKISAYVDFLKQGESKMAPALDLTPLDRNPSKFPWESTEKTSDSNESLTQN